MYRKDGRRGRGGGRRKEVRKIRLLIFGGLFLTHLNGPPGGGLLRAIIGPPSLRTGAATLHYLNYALS